MHSEGEKRGVGEEFLNCLWLLATTKGLQQRSCHHYEKLDRQVFEKFSVADVASFFRKADKGPSYLSLQYGDPSHNTVGVKKALRKLEAELLCIPPRSPDLIV